jgi:hypothetical protein
MVSLVAGSKTKLLSSTKKTMFTIREQLIFMNTNPKVAFVDRPRAGGETADHGRKRAPGGDREDAREVTITVPIANYDNNQHSSNENIRVQNLWDGIATMAALEAME